ncbi:MAG: adenylate/guanylate cyclase domain-containing protein [Verrucomicrobia bacterium]|nr:adenylate/guanylate cyclase domain-containing protein [Verrucomicrobiota bacterium]
MRLRTRLFLWVGLIFFVAFGISQFIEIYTTDRKLKDAESRLQKQILTVSEQRRQRIEEFLHVSLSEDQAQIDSLLLQIARDPQFGATLFLDPANLKLTAPYHAAFIFKNDKWTDFIQTTKDKQLTSLLIPISYPMDTAHHVPIDQEISWVVFDQDRDLQHPYIGVKLPINPIHRKSLSTLIDDEVEAEWTLTILFNPDALVHFVPKEGAQLAPGSGIDGGAFLQQVKHAADYLKTIGSYVKDVSEKGKGILFVGKPVERGIKCADWKGEIIDARVIQLMQRADQAILLSILTSLFQGGEFGTDLFAVGAPKGIARFTPDATAGHAILTTQTFFQKKVFNDIGYFEKHPGSQECKKMGASIAIIAPENMDRVFIGNAILLQDKNGSGYLTIGIDMEQICQDLVLSSRMGIFLVHGEKVINAYSPQGIKISKEDIPFDQKMLQSTSGIIGYKGTNYFYQQMTPFKGIDLHFFVFELEAEAFALVNAVKNGGRALISEVSYDMRIIGVIAFVAVLLLLHNIARRITRPITALANVTKQVAAGKLEDLEMPRPPDGRRDEVTALCNSFEQMVTGLKEKEKVKGVLNKVVSPEIAQEILRGGVQLGGEERKVTVFFADIRNFTTLSSHRDPQRVIEMLNTCMTKVSHVIDDFGGVIDKYVGDEVMALFGAPIEKEDSALKSIQCALKIVERLKEWNLERKAEGKVAVEMGIGIHTGVVVIGNMGAENRLNYTVIGSNVNFASRLCSAASGLEILISKETLAEPHVSENIEVELLEPMELKGFEGTFNLYRVLGEKKHV